MINVRVLCCALASILVMGNGARILGIVPTPSYSHQEVFYPIWKELSLRGHQVTTITTDPIKDPKLVNLTEIDLSCAYKIKAKGMSKFLNVNFIELMFQVLNVYEMMAHIFLSHQDVQNLIKNQTEQFDVVLVEHAFLTLFAFAKRFNAPLISIISVDAPSDLLSLMGNPTHPVLYPDWYSHVDDPSLIGRLMLVGTQVCMKMFKVFFSDPSLQLINEKYFGSGYALHKPQDVSLALVNSDPIFHKVRALLPTVVQIGGGGFHRAAPKPLPKELQHILDSSEDGFIYFSLGSNFQSKELPNITKTAIVEAFSELSCTVLWKFEEDSLPNKPENVFISKWFPQQDILRHPKVKLFITQSGLQSTDEAIYSHVPMLAIPILGDQKLNANQMVSKGFGLSLDYKTLNKAQFKETILEVVNNPKYRNKIKKLAKLALDQPMTGLKKAVWWTEYVIRHNGTKHLRSPLLDIPFYQYYLLDVAAVLLVALVALISVLVFIFKLSIKVIKVAIWSKKVKIN